MLLWGVVGAGGAGFWDCRCGGVGQSGAPVWVSVCEGGIWITGGLYQKYIKMGIR